MQKVLLALKLESISSSLEFNAKKFIHLDKKVDKSL